MTTALWHPFTDMAAVDRGELVLARGEGMFVWDERGRRWLGHEQERTTHIYLHSDLELKQRTLDRIKSPTSTPGRYQPPDRVLAFLDTL